MRLSTRKLDMKCAGCGMEVHVEAPIDAQGLYDWYAQFEEEHRRCRRAK